MHVSEIRKAVRPYRSGRNRRTKKQGPDPKAETSDAIPEKIQEVEKEAAVVEEEEETKCCPLCTEPLDPTECNLYPCCFCKFQICLFCLNRLKQEEISSEQQSVAESEKRVCGSCPGCRKPYPADSDDESMVIAVRMTKKQTKGGTEKTGNRNRNTNWKHETRTAANAEKTDNRSPRNRSQPLLLTQAAKRAPNAQNDHHKHQGKETAVNYQSEKATDCSRAADRLRASSQSSPLTSHSKVRVRGHGRRVRDKAAITSADPDREADQKQDAGSIKEESTSEQKQELVSLLSSLGLSPCNIHFS